MENNKHFLFPSTLIVCREPECVTTILGSCVSVCLYDPVNKLGGMNHYMLPYWNGVGLPSPKFGNIAIKKLVEEMLNRGSKKSDLIAKVFGGANVSKFNQNIYNVDKRNISIAHSILKELDIPVVSSCLGGNRGRKIMFCTDTGKVLHKSIIK